MAETSNAIHPAIALAPSTGISAEVKLHGFSAPFWLGPATKSRLCRKLKIGEDENIVFTLKGEKAPTIVCVLHKGLRQGRVAADAQKASKAAQARLKLGWTRGLRLPKSLLQEIDTLRLPKPGSKHGIESRSEVLVRLVHEAQSCRGICRGNISAYDGSPSARAQKSTNKHALSRIKG